MVNIAGKWVVQLIITQQYGWNSVSQKKITKKKKTPKIIHLNFSFRTPFHRFSGIIPRIQQWSCLSFPDFYKASLHRLLSKNP